MPSWADMPWNRDVRLSRGTSNKRHLLSQTTCQALSTRSSEQPDCAQDIVSKADNDQLRYLTAPVRPLNDMGLAQTRSREAGPGQLRFLPLFVRKPAIMSGIIIYLEGHFFSCLRCWVFVIGEEYRLIGHLP